MPTFGHIEAIILPEEMTNPKKTRRENEGKARNAAPKKQFKKVKVTGKIMGKK